MARKYRQGWDSIPFFVPPMPTSSHTKRNKTATSTKRVMSKNNHKKVSRKEADELIKRLRAGTLTSEYFSSKGFDRSGYKEPYHGLNDFDAFYELSMIRWQVRKHITDECSWFIFTKAWLDAMTSLLEGRRVVEVCAGKGVLGPLMASRGVDWICTDVEPGSEHVFKLNAFETDEILHLQPDVLFAAWIPYTSELDITLAETRCPMILVGESPGGCTGCEEFYEHEAWKGGICPGLVIEGFEDIPVWDGIHDHTTLINWFKDDRI